MRPCVPEFRRDVIPASRRRKSARPRNSRIDLGRWNWIVGTRAEARLSRTPIPKARRGRGNPADCKKNEIFALTRADPRDCDQVSVFTGLLAKMEANRIVSALSRIAASQCPNAKRRRRSVGAMGVLFSYHPQRRWSIDVGRIRARRLAWSAARTCARQCSCEAPRGRRRA